MIVPGDVNSTLAASLVAAKLCLPSAHLEAGLRSFDRSMPEEINRIVADEFADLLFAHSDEALANLAHEGIDESRVHLVGNTMIDSLVACESRFRGLRVAESLGLVPGKYVLVTLHRPALVDGPLLGTVMDALEQLSERIPIVFPVHPRTRANLADNTSRGQVTLIDPLGYLEFLSLEADAGAVLTDSGGVQEETSYLGVPCFTLRESTERPVTIRAGTNTLLGVRSRGDRTSHARSSALPAAEYPFLGRTRCRACSRHRHRFRCCTPLEGGVGLPCSGSPDSAGPFQRAASTAYRRGGAELAMCGIVGMATAPGSKSPTAETLNRAVAALRHRGPDGSGVHLNGRIALGHTRLSIIDVEGGAQPLGNEDGSVQTIFNGEIWNHDVLRRTLEAAGHRFRTRCDTEVLVHGWEEWGDGPLGRIEGMFAFAIWDDRAGLLVLARDRTGKKPLYVAATELGIAFGSDARAVAIVSGRTPEVEPAAVATHLFQRYSVAPQTLFRGIERLEPGHLLTYDGARIERRPYWVLEPGAEESLTPHDLRELLREAVRARLMSDVPLGVLLSGGIDSTAILGLAREVGAEGIDTFTIGFADALYDERELARLAATRHGARHHEVVVDNASFLEALPRLAWFRDEPIAEPSEIPLLLLAEFAGRHVKVALGGDGGDEMFGGYPKYRAERLLRLGKIVPAGILGRAIQAGSRKRTYRRMGRAAETLSTGNEQLRWASWFRSFNPAEISQLVVPELAATAAPENLLGPLAES